jgi:hypothetical protein
MIGQKKQPPRDNLYLVVQFCVELVAWVLAASLAVLGYNLLFATDLGLPFIHGSGFGGVLCFLLCAALFTALRKEVK